MSQYIVIIFVNSIFYNQIVLMTPIAIVRFILTFFTCILLFTSSYLFYAIKQIHRPVNYHEVKKYYLTVPLFFMKTLLVIFGIQIRTIEEDPSMLLYFLKNAIRLFKLIYRTI